MATAALKVWQLFGVIGFQSACTGCRPATMHRWLSALFPEQVLEFTQLKDVRFMEQNLMTNTTS